MTTTKSWSYTMPSGLAESGPFPWQYAYVGQTITAAVTDFARQVKEQTFKRVTQSMNRANRTHEAQVVPFAPEYTAYFEALNREWIEQHFAVEEPDRAVFADPFGTIVAPGGQVFFVIAGGQVLGTCAVIRHSESVFELAKMAVSSEARGRGYGDLLIKAAVDFARLAEARTLMLISNSELAPALGLYAKHGFRDVPLRGSHGYDRADVQMELDLRAKAEEAGS